MQEDQIGTDPNTFTETEEGINTYSDGEAIDSSDDASIGQEVGVAIVPPEEVDAIGVTVTDSNGEVFLEDTLIPESPVVFSFIPDKPGEWTVAADFFNGTILTETLSVSFFVVPESPIGVIAILASSLATLLWFIRRRNNDRKTRLI
jgi:hypothetical protein